MEGYTMAFTKEFLTGLGLTEEQATQVFAERGKELERDKMKYDTLSQEKEGLKVKYDTLSQEKAELDTVAGDLNTYKLKIAEFEQREIQRTEAERKAKEDEILTTAVLSAIGDKDFVNDWTKNSIVNEIKSRMENGEKDIIKTFQELTKDQEGIFKNPNPIVEIPPVGNVQMDITKEQYQSMGYADRFKLKTEQPELYKTFTE